MTYYINAIPLTDAYLENRSSSDSWNVKTKGAQRIPFIERGSQDPTDFDVDLKFLGAERYNVATSVSGEIEQCQEVLLHNDASKKLYGTDEWVWIKQNEFSIIEESGHRLTGRITGLIDPYMIHSCDFATNWTGDGTVSTTSPHDGKQCIKHTKTSPSTTTTYALTYTPADALNLSDFSKIRFWIKSAKLSSYYSNMRLIIRTDVSNFDYWNIAITTADTWQYKTYALASPDGGTGTLNLASIEDIEFSITTSSGTDDIELYVDTITMQ